MFSALYAFTLCIFAQLALATHVVTVTTYTTTTICPLTETFISKGQTSTQTRTTTSTVTMEVVKTLFATAPPSTVTRQVDVNVTQYTTNYVPVTVTPLAVTLVNSSTTTVRRNTAVTLSVGVATPETTSSPEGPPAALTTRSSAVQLSTKVAHALEEVPGPATDAKIDVKPNADIGPELETYTDTAAKTEAETVASPHSQAEHPPSSESEPTVAIDSTIETKHADTTSPKPTSTPSTVDNGHTSSVLGPTSMVVQVGAAGTWKVSWIFASVMALFFAYILG